MASDLVTRTRLAREKSLPEIPKSLGPDAISSLGAMREQVERLSGKAGEASDRAVRLFEVEMGLLSAYMPTPVDVSRNATPGGGGLRILKAPRGLQYEHLIFGIRLIWENMEPRHSAVEIWCAEDSLLLDDAWRVGVATKPMSEWTMHGISMRINYTFWIRAVDWTGGVSPWCPAQGQGGLIVPAQIDATVTEVLEVLTGRVTNSQLHQALSSKIDMIEGHTAAIQEQAQVIDGLSAQWFVKLDVDGRVSGIGLHGTGASSEFIVLADKFMVVTPGANPQVPFVVGPLGETGETGVGINGGLVVNGSILARHLDAGSVTADKIGADQISGQHIAATSDIILNEGGTLTVGQNNIVLDSELDRLVVAPDNGADIGAPNYSGVDYAELRDGDLFFMYWNGSSHVLYNSVKRIESDTEVQNGVEVTIPGLWRSVPKIIVTPHSIQTYNKNYSLYNQKINCWASNVSRSESGVVTFTPTAMLSLSDGSVVSNPNMVIDPAPLDPGGRTWYYWVSSVWNSTANAIRVAASGYATITGSSLANKVTMTISLYIDGVSRYSTSGYWDPVSGTRTLPWSADISGLAQGLHTIYLRLGLYQSSSDNDNLDLYAICNSMTCWDGTFSQLSAGTLDYLAIGA